MSDSGEKSTKYPEIRISKNVTPGLELDFDNSIEKTGAKTRAEGMVIILEKARKYDEMVSWAEKFNVRMDEVEEFLGINSIIKRGEESNVNFGIKAFAMFLKALKKAGTI